MDEQPVVEQRVHLAKRAGPGNLLRGSGGVFLDQDRGYPRRQECHRVILNVGTLLRLWY